MSGITATTVNVDGGIPTRSLLASSAALAKTLTNGRKVASMELTLIWVVTDAIGTMPTGLLAETGTPILSLRPQTAALVSEEMGLALKLKTPPTWAVTTAIGTGPTKTLALMLPGMTVTSPPPTAAPACDWNPDYFQITKICFQ